MISLAHELFMSEYYTLTLSVGMSGVVCIFDVLAPLTCLYVSCGVDVTCPYMCM